jgi:HEAT repeat protein
MPRKSKITKVSAAKNTVVPPKAAPIKTNKDSTVTTPAKSPVHVQAVVPPRASAPRIDIQPILENLRSIDSSTRADAASALGRLGEQAAIAPLIQALRDSDADVAREAATSLGLLGNASVVEALIGVVNNNDEYYHTIVRAAAAISLAQLKDLRAVEPLIIAVRDPIAEVCAEAIRALALLGDARAIVALEEVIQNSNGYYLPIAVSTATLALARFNRENTAAD